MQSEILFEGRECISCLGRRLGGEEKDEAGKQYQTEREYE
jgi:hypothetical protein